MNWASHNKGKRVDPLLASSSSQTQLVNLVSDEAELVDPNPDLHASFQLFDFQFFDGALGRCTVEWSKRMKSCAGICYYQRVTGLCTIRLSEPLLKLRPRKDFVQTLLHEMIHAYLFVTERYDNHDGHGSNFQAHMNRINRIAGTNITIYHSFHDEVALYKTYWWRCDGECRSRAPYFGYVNRSMNRAPSANDFWFATHKATCKGTFHAIEGPNGQKLATIKPKLKKRTASTALKDKENKQTTWPTTSQATPSEPFQPISNVFVPCPSCANYVTMAQLNSHLDVCLTS